MGVYYQRMDVILDIILREGKVVMDERLFEGLSEEQKEALKNCKTTEEIMELVAEEGLELNEVQMEAVSGGACGESCTLTDEQRNGMLKKMNHGL